MRVSVSRSVARRNCDVGSSRFIRMERASIKRYLRLGATGFTWSIRRLSFRNGQHWGVAGGHSASRPDSTEARERGAGEWWRRRTNEKLVCCCSMMQCARSRTFWGSTT